jgi:L-methionine (R)-S-oxide reductase
MFPSVYLLSMVRDNRYDSLITEIRTLAAHEDPGGALQRICALLRSAVGHYDWVGFYLAASANGDRMLVLGPFDGAPTEHLQIAFGRGICGQAAERGERVIVPDVREAGNYLACSIETRAEIVLPVFHAGRFIAELDIDSHTVDPFGPFDEEFLEEVVAVTTPLLVELTTSLRC